MIKKLLVLIVNILYLCLLFAHLKINIDAKSFDIATYFYALVLFAYCGCSQFVAIIKTHELPKGQMCQGNKKSILYVIYLSLFTFLFTFALQQFTNVKMPLALVFVSFSSCVFLYVAGQKVKMVYENKTKTEGV